MPERAEHEHVGIAPPSHTRRVMRGCRNPRQRTPRRERRTLWQVQTVGMELMRDSLALIHQQRHTRTRGERMQHATRRKHVRIASNLVAQLKCDASAAGVCVGGLQRLKVGREASRAVEIGEDVEVVRPARLRLRDAQTRLPMMPSSGLDALA